MIKMCEKCNTPLQREIPFLINGKNLINCKCKCQLEKEKQLDLEFEQRQQLFKIQACRNNKLFDRTIKNKTFENSLEYDPKTLSIAKRYAEKFETVLKENYGIIFWGEFGTGKTYYSACIANKLLDNGYTVMFTSASKLISETQGIDVEYRMNYIQSLNQYKLLVLDDLGTERYTQSANEILYNIINERYCNELPLIVNTNFTFSYMQNIEDISSKRIYERIIEKCIPIEVKNNTVRTNNAKDRKENFIKEILEV